MAEQSPPGEVSATNIYHLKGHPRQEKATVEAVANAPISSPAVSASASDQVAKGIDDIKRMLGGQKWGLSAEQLIGLTERMKPFANTFNAWSQSGGDFIDTSFGNSDGIKFCYGLVASLRSAGWNLPGTGFGQAMYTVPVEGLIVILHSKEDAGLPILNQFLAVMKDAGIQFHGEIDEKEPAGQFRIIIGSKPE